MHRAEIGKWDVLREGFPGGSITSPLLLAKQG
jgi:hypothetical protein